MRTKFILLLALFSYFDLNSQTNFVAQYNFSNVENGSEFSFINYDGENFEGIILHEINRNGISPSSSKNNFRASGWPIEENSVDFEKYIDFTIEAESGYSFTVDSIQFGIGRSAAGPTSWQWRGSIDNYESAFNDYLLHTNLECENGIITVENKNSYWNKNTLKLGNNYQDIITFANFRFYGFNAKSKQGTGGLQGDLFIYGSCFSVKEEENKTFLNSENIENVKIYPNPAKYFVTIEFPDGADNISIINHSGQTVFEVNPSENSREYIINVERFNNGIYFVNIRNGNNVILLKLLKK